MRLQEQIVRQTQRALGDVLRAIEALPADKQDWSPGPPARSALAQLQEIAVAPGLHKLLVLGEELSPQFHMSIQAEARKLTTVAAAKEAAQKSTADLCDLILSFPDDQLDKEVTLPFGPGMVFTLADILGLDYWNMTYHLGQINYIQTLLGDTQMH